jgi:hypothetical protein
MPRLGQLNCSHCAQIFHGLGCAKLKGLLLRLLIAADSLDEAGCCAARTKGAEKSLGNTDHQHSE